MTIYVSHINLLAAYIMSLEVTRIMTIYSLYICHDVHERIYSVTMLWKKVHRFVDI